MAEQTDTPLRTGGEQGYLRIAAEEAFAPREMIETYRKILGGPDVDPGFESLMGFYINNQAERPRFIFERLQDLGELRIADMDVRGIDRQVIGITAPGTQILPAAEGHALSVLANDQLAEACSKYPDRFTGMAACAPHAPEQAAKEIERAVTRLGMRAVVINSHTHGEYLDNPKFAPVLEAAEAVGAPIYIHPQTPPRTMIQPMLEAGLDGAIFGFGVETGMHALRMITAGIFDRFPRLQVILGHMGEALPFWMYRVDFMHQAGIGAGRYEFLKPLKKGKISNYLRENFYFTNSGVAWEPAIKFAQQVIGEDRVLYAMDYPYQCPPEEVRTLDAMDMRLETKKKFFQTNAERLFRI
jgi:2,3-dihydroxybenzoate decarboxylase